MLTIIRKTYLKACSWTKEHVLLRDHNILKGDRPGVGSPLSHVPLLPAFDDARGVCINNETGERLAGRTLGIGVGAGEDEVEISNSSVCYPHLLTIQDPVISLKNVVSVRFKASLS